VGDEVAVILPAGEKTWLIDAIRYPC
jgi:transcription elongation factor GreB